MDNSCLDLAFNDDTRIVVIMAPAGFGKTRILHEFADQQRASGILSWFEPEETDFAGKIVATIAAIRELAASAQILIIDGADRLAPEVRSVLCALFLECSPQGRLILALRDWLMEQTSA